MPHATTQHLTTRAPHAPRRTATQDWSENPLFHYFDILISSYRLDLSLVPVTYGLWRLKAFPSPDVPSSVP